MPAAAVLLTGTVIFWLLSCVVIAISGKKINHTYASAALLAGAVVMFAAAIMGLSADVIWSLPPPFYIAVAPLTNRLDALASIFIGLLSVITIAVALFSPGYLNHLQEKINTGCYWAELYLFVIGMLGVVLAANAVTFLVFWELIALTSALLIVTNLSSHECRKAAFIYLGATRISTALLMAGFLWMHEISASWDFKSWQFDSDTTIVPALMILLAFCIKAGIWPFHDWLPHAHPAAPSPVSALMSGVMIKVSLYAIIRILVSGGEQSHWISYLMLTLGLISVFWGILSALIQKDLKCLLAYCSIENVGLILVAISLALIGQDLQLPMVAAISLSAAIFHCVNHGLFKSLLFLGAGSIDSRTHTRDLERLGGLGKNMPVTMWCFVIGSAAICALPPLNGFNSKWLVYQSFFQIANGSGSLWLSGFAIICIAILGMASGMSVYTFTKAIGISFLGRPRSAEAEHAHEVTGYMLAAQGLLAACCIFLGVCAPVAMAIIQPVLDNALRHSYNLQSVYTIPMGAFGIALLALTAIIYKFLLAGSPEKVKRYHTWECGFGVLGPRMQATATSFAENVGYTFSPLFRYRKKSIIAGRDRRHFPDEVEIDVQTTALLEAQIYAPAVRLITWIGEHMLMLQAGSVHLYLGYILLTLVGLMAIGILL